MNNSRKTSKKTSKQGEKIEAAGKPAESIGCPGIHHAPGSTLHSRIRAISPHLLKILKKQQSGPKIGRQQSVLWNRTLA